MHRLPGDFGSRKSLIRFHVASAEYSPESPGRDGYSGWTLRLASCLTVLGVAAISGWVRPYLISASVLAGIILVSFLVVESLGIPLLADPSTHILRGGVIAALVGGGLLVADVFIPVPSSIIMIAHGAAFGIWGGFLLSVMASVVGSLIGWGLGRRGGRILDKAVSEADKTKARDLLNRYGLVALMLSRMIPILSETVVIMAGVSGMSLRRVVLPIVLGTIPPAIIYAWAGTMAWQGALGLWIAGAVFAIAGIAWWLSSRCIRSRS